MAQEELGVQNWRAWALGMYSHTFSWILGNFSFFDNFFDPEPKKLTKFLSPDERRDVAKMLMNFWFEVEKISKN